MLPLLDNHRHLRAYACDFSAIAVSLLAKQAASAGLQDRLDTFVADLRVPGALRGPHKLPGPHCIDVITAMFVLSAIEPSSLSTVRTCTWQYNHGEPSTTAQAVHNLRSVLRPGGLVLLRDYADGDLAQHRLAGKAYPPHTSLSATAPSHRRDQCLGDRLYVRQDGTMCCYFTEVCDVQVHGWSLKWVVECSNACAPGPAQVTIYICWLCCDAADCARRGAHQRQARPDDAPAMAAGRVSADHVYTPTTRPPPAPRPDLHAPSA